MNVSDLLCDLVADEPAYDLRPAEALQQGRRRRTRQRAMTSGALVITLGAASVGVLALAGRGGGNGPTDSVAAASPPASAPAPQTELERAFRSSVPDGWTVTEPAGDRDGTGFEAYVDDGQGASRVYVGRSPSPGTLQQHPCSDPEFHLTGTCVETEQPDGSRLILRGPARSGPVTSQLVVIVLPDGGGVEVGSDNATWPSIDRTEGLPSAEEKSALDRPTVTRPLPVYSLSRLTALATLALATR